MSTGKVLYGCDISHWNDVDVCDLSKHVDFVICKATEGTGYTDPTFYDRFQQLEWDNVLKGCYHFLHPGNVEQQAQYFMERTYTFNGSFVPIVDWEETQDGDIASATDVWGFVSRYHDSTGIWPWVYTRENILGNSFYGDLLRDRCGIWLAYYYPQANPTFDDAVLSLQYSPTCDCWQFASDCPINGTELDGDLFFGDREAWLRYCRGGATADPVPYEPTSEVLWENASYRLILETK